jgi:hypothetical protein
MFCDYKFIIFGGHWYSRSGKKIDKILVFFFFFFFFFLLSMKLIEWKL